MITISTLIAGNAFGQSSDTGYYYKYTFDNFLNNKTESAKEYLRVIYKNLNYPKAERENGIEGIINILIINSGFEDSRIIALNDIFGLDEAAVEIIKIAHEKYSLPTKEKYMTELSVAFNYEDDYYRTAQETYKNCDIIITSMPTRQKQELTNK